MAPFYRTICEQLGWEREPSWLAALRAANVAELAQLDEKLCSAKLNEGESEICAAMLARAEFLARIGERERALHAYDETFAKTVALGPRLDLLLAKMRIGFFFGDVGLVSTTLEKAKALLEDGGDWERRNRLKVYESIFFLRCSPHNKGR